MYYTAVNGIYEDGKLILAENPPVKGKSNVVVLFLGDQDINPDSKPAIGVKLGSLEGQYSIPDSFNDPLDDLKEYM